MKNLDNSSSNNGKIPQKEAPREDYPESLQSPLIQASSSLESLQQPPLQAPICSTMVLLHDFRVSGTQGGDKEAGKET